jgi:hypothetical protein
MSAYEASIEILREVFPDVVDADGKWREAEVAVP